MSLIILLVVLFVVGVALIIAAVKRDEEGFFWPGLALMMIFVVLIAIALPSQYGESLRLPEDVIALSRAIDEIETYLSDDTTLGEGLEGIELKNELAGYVADLHATEARIRYINKNSWIVFKVDGVWE